MTTKEILASLGITIAALLVISAGVWGLAAIPHCTHLSEDTTICSRYETPWKKVIWRE